MSDTESKQATADAEAARVEDIVEVLEGQRRRIDALLRENGFSPEKMAALARKNGVQAIGAQYRRANEPGFYTEPAAPKHSKRVRTRI